MSSKVYMGNWGSAQSMQHALMYNTVDTSYALPSFMLRPQHVINAAAPGFDMSFHNSTARQQKQAVHLPPEALPTWSGLSLRTRHLCTLLYS